jgi:hypothetical protein
MIDESGDTVLSVVDNQLINLVGADDRLSVWTPAREV